MEGGERDGESEGVVERLDERRRLDGWRGVVERLDGGRVWWRGWMNEGGWMEGCGGEAG